MSLEDAYIGQSVWSPVDLDPDVVSAEALEALGVKMHWAQRQFLSMAEQIGDDGKRAVGEVFVTGDRQSGKTVAVELLMLWAIVSPNPRRIMYTGPDSITVDSTFRSLVNRVEALRAPRVVRKIRKARGAQEIEATNGARIIFRSRGGRGVRGVVADTLIFDDAEDLDEEVALSGIAASLTSPDPQCFYVGFDLDRGFLGARRKELGTVASVGQARENGLNRVGEINMGQLENELARGARRMFAGLTR